MSADFSFHDTNESFTIELQRWSNNGTEGLNFTFQQFIGDHIDAVEIHVYDVANIDRFLQALSKAVGHEVAPEVKP